MSSEYDIYGFEESVTDDYDFRVAVSMLIIKNHYRGVENVIKNLNRGHVIICGDTVDDELHPLCFAAQIGRYHIFKLFEKYGYHRYYNYIHHFNLKNQKHPLVSAVVGDWSDPIEGEYKMEEKYKIAEYLLDSDCWIITDVVLNEALRNLLSYQDMIEYDLFRRFLQLFIRHGAVDRPDLQGKSTLLMESICGNTWNCRDDHDNFPYANHCLKDCSVCIKRIDVFRLLLDINLSDINAKNSMGKTILMICIESRISEIFLRSLFSHHVDATLTDNKNRSAIQIAHKQGNKDNKEIVRHLMDYERSRILGSLKNLCITVSSNLSGFQKLPPLIKLRNTYLKQTINSKQFQSSNKKRKLNQ
jgi:hypothetical protein